MDEFLSEKIKRIVLSENTLLSQLNSVKGLVHKDEDQSIEKQKHQMLCLATEHCYMELLCLLLDSGVPPHTQVSNSHKVLPQPLHIACELGEAHLIQILVDAGADVNTYACSLGKEPKFSSVSSAVEKVLLHDDPFLLKILASKYEVEKSPKGLTLTYLACKTGAVHCLGHILKTSAKDVNVADKMGVSPISFALFGNVNMLKILLKHGAEPNGKNQYGWSIMYRVLHPFSWGLQPNLINENVLRTVEVLASSGIDVDDVHPEQSSFQMLSCQIRAAFSHARDSQHLFVAEEHQRVVHKLAKVILDSMHLNGNDIARYIHHVLDAEVKQCCEMFAIPFFSKPSYDQMNEFFDNFSPMKAFDALKNALTLARDLISITMNANKNNEACDPSSAAQLLNDIVSCLEANSANVSQFQSCPWDEITELFYNMVQLIVLQVIPLPYEPQDVLAVPNDQVHETVIYLVQEVICQRDHCKINTNCVGQPSSKVKRLESLARLRILSWAQVPRLQCIQSLFVPEYLKSYLSLKII